MAYTFAALIPEYVNGLMLGQSRLLSKLDDAYVIPEGAEAGAITVRQWSTITSETPSAGTFLAQGVANVTANLTLTHKFVTNLLSVNQRQALETRPQSRLKLGQKMADKLVQDMQAQVIASLKAASITDSTALAAGYASFSPPSAATNADLINNIIAPVSNKVETMVANNQGSSIEDFYIIMPVLAFSNFVSVVQASPYRSDLERNGTNTKFRGVDMFAVNGTNFTGAASTEVAFFGHKEGFAFINDGVKPWRGGGMIEDPDGQIRMSLYAAYAYGMVDETKLAELTNGTS